MAHERIENRTLNLEDAGQMFGISRTTAHKLARIGQFPVPVFRVGHQLRVSREAVEEVLGRRKREEERNEAA